MGSSGEQNGVRWTIEGRVAQVVLDLPPVNIVGADLIIGLSALLTALSEAEVTVAVFRSADPDFFLMHGDVEMLVQVPVSHYPRQAGRPTGANPRVIARAFRELWGLRRELRALPIRGGTETETG